MPEEPTTEISEVETPMEAPPAETPTHPLEPGGPRFEEVIRQKNEAREAEAFWKRQYEALAVKNTAQPQPIPPKRVYTPQEVDQAVTAGQISIAQAADLIASQRVDASREQYRLDAHFDRVRTDAQTEVSQYLERVPSLGRTDSPEFVRVARTAHEIAQELGLRVEDPRVQRRALRESFGTLDRLKAAGSAREVSRQSSDTYVEAGGGGGNATPPSKDAEKLKSVPAPLKAHWDRMGYDEKRRLAELPYVDMNRWKRLG